MKPRVLIVDDEPAIAEIVSYALVTDGFEAQYCATAAAAITSFQNARPSIAIIDLGLPDMSGFELFKTLQAIDRDVPMLFLTARSDEIDRVVGLELGADDYIAKPFSPRELTARVRMILRRSAKRESEAEPAESRSAPQADAALFVVDDARKQIRFSGHKLDLSRYEYGLLKTLLTHSGHVYSREQLLAHVWDDPAESLDRTVDAHIKTLRAKLKSVRAELDPIRTHRGLGYSIES
jgi:two-component system, OmpR family, catabolic regulation response regulator CreB